MKQHDWDKAQLARDARIVNGSPEGERLIGYLFDFCHFHRNTHVAGSADVTAFNEGQRSVALEVFSLLYNEPDRYKVATHRKIADQAEGK